MAHPLVSKWRSLLPHGFLEQTGVLLWLISVLVIGLRCFLVIVEQPTFVQVIRLGIGTLYWCAKVLVVAGIGGALGVRLRGQSRLARQQASRSPVQKVRLPHWPGLSRIAALATECLVAAGIMQTGLRWAEQGTLPWTTAGLLAAVAALHILLAVYHEHVNARIAIRR